MWGGLVSNHVNLPQLLSFETPPPDPGGGEHGRAQGRSSFSADSNGSGGGADGARGSGAGDSGAAGAGRKLATDRAGVGGGSQDGAALVANRRLATAASWRAAARNRSLHRVHRAAWARSGLERSGAASGTGSARVQRQLSAGAAPVKAAS